MGEKRNAEQNSPSDVSPSTSMSVKESLKINSESSTSQSTNGKIEDEHQSKVLRDSEISAVQDNLDGPPLNQNVLSPTNDADESQPRIEDVASSSMEALDIQYPLSSDAPQAQSSSISHQFENDASVRTTNVQVEVVTSNNSSVTTVTENYIDPVASDEIDLPQVKVTNVIHETSKPMYPSKHMKQVNVDRVLIDTAAPFESVKEAVNKYGGIVDWKAHKILTVERRKNVQVELEKAEEDIPRYKKQSEAAEDDKAQVLKELDRARKLIEVLKQNVEKAQTEENQAKQDSELAHLRAEEMEQGIANEASIAAKAQLEVAKARHVAAVADLKLVKDEMEALKGDYISLVTDRNLAVKRAEAAVCAMKETEKMVEELTLDLILAKESLESAQAAHMEAEEKRIVATMTQEKDSFIWEKELKQAKEDLQRLNGQLLSAKDLELKLDTASALLVSLKAELAAYVEAKLTQETGSIEKEENLGGEIKGGERILTDAQVELKEIMLRIEKAKYDINCLRVAEASLQSELDKEKAGLTAIRQREGMAFVAVSSLEAELSGVHSELELVQLKEKEAKEKMVELPMELQEASQEADQVRLEVNSAREELRKAKEEAEQVKAGARTVESRLHAALKEIAAAKVAERLALAAAKALQESEMAASLGCEDVLNSVTLSLEDYYMLSRRAHEAEEEANMRVETAIAQIEVAKESESRSLERLEEANRELVKREEALSIAMEKAEKANEGKLGVEQELRKWRAESGQRRRASDAAASAVNHVRSLPTSPDKECDTFELGPTVSVSEHCVENGQAELKSGAVDLKVKKKKSFFPRVVMFLARKKSHSSK
ncbi:protein WEAK CHLOROPLAST MOVEMENT UNDER BLUE LIGHT 1-like [Magnolia sinica]|uniref:protein WEAK CHLOROPLAST MOVEMENT UNDER BLUE LIGHT 1-like n=1 Tax=Magnolia sinica TaxID=86752 RepID=UPI002657F2BA|nr:protein WEAK CHLOROPLAST MOVEMENT UNDER BLUE LIGHT 1-like [Magnolia sinica]